MTVPPPAQQRRQLNKRLDALLSVLGLNRSRTLLRDLQAIAKRRGLPSGEYRLKLLYAIYEGMK